MEILLQRSSSLFLQSHYLLHSTNNACASAQREAVQQAHANTKGLLTALELALQLSADETPLTPTAPTHARLPEAVVFLVAFLVVATLLVGIHVTVMAHSAREIKPPGTTYGSTESIVDVEMGFTSGWDTGAGLPPRSTVVLPPGTTYGSTESVVDVEMGFTSGLDTGVGPHSLRVVWEDPPPEAFRGTTGTEEAGTEGLANPEIEICLDWVVSQPYCRPGGDNFRDFQGPLLDGVVPPSLLSEVRESPSAGASRRLRTGRETRLGPSL